MRWPIALLCLFAGCAKVAGDAPSTATESLDDGATPAPVPGPDPVEPKPPYGPEVVSLRLRQSIVVRFAADKDSKSIGTIAQDTRVKWRAWAAGPGCTLWIQIEPRGWVCERYLEATTKKPTGVELPKLKEGELLPGTYGMVKAGGAAVYKTPEDIERKKPLSQIAGQVKVRLIEQIEADNHLWWKTLEGEYLLASQVTVLEPSEFVGVKDPKLPLAWAQSGKNRRQRVAVLDAPGGAEVKSLKPRTVVAVAGESDDGRWIQIGKGQWVAAADLRIARATTPPPTTRDDERWFDVDVAQQVVVAYEGRRPAYATLVSSGNKKWPTALGIYRVWIKFAETDMNGQMGDEAPYSVSKVPWTMFFAKDLAFHTAYWHDDFGEGRSHGCLNLSPRDARWLYFWASPDVPPGWSMVHGIAERPGSLVRVRSKGTPEPEWKGYAKEVYEQRLGRDKKP